MCWQCMCYIVCVCIYMVCVVIPRTEEPGGLRSAGCRVGHDCTSNTHIYFDTIRNKPVGCVASSRHRAPLTLKISWVIWVREVSFVIHIKPLSTTQEFLLMKDSGRMRACPWTPFQGERRGGGGGYQWARISSPVPCVLEAPENPNWGVLRVSRLWSTSGAGKGVPPERGRRCTARPTAWPWAPLPLGRSQVVSQ